MKALIQDSTWGSYGRGPRANVGLSMIRDIWTLAQKAATSETK